MFLIPSSSFTSFENSKAEGLCQKGAVMADSPSAVDENSDVVFTVVG